MRHHPWQTSPRLANPPPPRCCAAPVSSIASHLSQQEGLAPPVLFPRLSSPPCQPSCRRWSHHRANPVHVDQSSARARCAGVAGRPRSFAVRAGLPRPLVACQAAQCAVYFFSILIFVSKFLKIIQTSKIHSNSHQIHKNTK
jgi:hypothetical protein